MYDEDLKNYPNTLLQDLNYKHNEKKKTAKKTDAMSKINKKI